LLLTQIIESGETSEDVVMTSLTLTLTFEDRRHSRLLVQLDSGEKAALMLPRGTLLRHGDRLRGEGPGPTVRIRAANETLSVARTSDAHLLTRAAYHLGNRHVPLQIGSGWLAYQHDHVLDALARELGMEVTVDHAPFEPEAGGYGHHGSQEAGTHPNAHTHAHADHQHEGKVRDHDSAP
jgi:urease accessory protein